MIEELCVRPLLYKISMGAFDIYLEGFSYNFHLLANSVILAITYTTLLLLCRYSSLIIQTLLLNLASLEIIR